MGSYLMMLLLQSCNLFIAMSLSRSSVSHFQCTENRPVIPRIKSIILRSWPLKPLIPTAIGISATECAALCVRTQFNGCQSYSYDPVTASCYTRNNTLSRNGIICGMKADEARSRCRGKGDALIAFGGQKKTMMECICGGDSTGWTNASEYGAYNCVDACQGEPCAVDMFNNGCEVCIQPAKNCVNAVYFSPGNRLICITLP